MTNEHSDADAPIEATLGDVEGDVDPQTEANAVGEYARGTTIGRYVVLERVGAGGMGVVYAAYDPDLDRRVALKLLRARIQDDGAAEARTRLLREAQAMARLHHPNVIAVHDVGTVHDRVFIAMEFIEGRTLSDWIRATSPRQEDILRVFVDAGRGLIAAHDVGLIHRDFKPDNVIVGFDGRVYVLDFGLARDASRQAPAKAEAPFSERITRDLPSGVSPYAEDQPSGPLEEALTRTGVMLGTPAYMAPEQHLGGEVSALSDQFSFCVALYEAVYGERPFSGSSHADLIINVSEGQLRDPPPASRVSARLRRVLLRGLCPRVEDRHPDMRALLAALQADSRPLRRRIGWAGLAVGLVAIGALGAGQLTAKQPSICRGAADRLAGVWDEPVRRQAQRAFEGTGKAFAGDAWGPVSSALDDYVQKWSEAHRDACEATHVRGEQSAALLDRRMVCLDRRRGELQAITALLADADAAIVAQASDAVRGLPEIEHCNDMESLIATGTAPPSLIVRAEVEVQTRALAEAKALGHAGRIKAALEIARDAVAAARRVDYRPLEARALYVLGEIQEVAGELPEAHATFYEALLASEASGDVRQEAKAWIRLSWVNGYHRSDFEEAHKAGRHAGALMERVGTDSVIYADYQRRYADVLWSQGRYGEALTRQREALALYRRLHGPVHPTVADARNGIGHSFLGMGRYEDALVEYEAALAITKTAYGARHPDVATRWTNLGIAYDHLHRKDEAAKANETALQIVIEALGPEHLDVATVRNNLASAYLGLGRLEEARDQFIQARVIWEASYGSSHPDVALAIDNLAIVTETMGRFEEAEQLYREALQLRQAALGDEHPAVATSYDHVGEMLQTRGRLDEAAQLHRRAQSIYTKLGDLDPTYIAGNLMLLGDIELASRRPGSALQLFERALSRTDKGVETYVPVVTKALLKIGQARTRLGQRDGALQALHRAASLVSQHGEATAQEPQAVEALIKQARLLPGK